MLRQNPKTFRIPRRGAYRMDVSTRGGKLLESRYCNLLDKTGLAPNTKGDHRGIY